MSRIPLIIRIIIAIVLGIIFGQFLPLPLTRLFATFNAIFSQFLGFMIPLIIAGLVAPAIADIGRGARKLLLTTIVIAYLDTVLAGLLGYGAGLAFFPSLLEKVPANNVEDAVKVVIEPYFTIAMPPLLDVMSALILAFLMGISIAYLGLPTLRAGFMDFRRIVVKTIEHAIIPILPLYIFGIFLIMTSSGQVYHILKIFALVIIVIFILHIIILLYEFVVAGLFTHRNPWRLFVKMLPAYFTALGTSSSAATIPVTLKQSIKNGVRESVAGFSIPLCATIHMPGSSMKVTACALTICLLNGMPFDFGTYLYFILFIAIIMVAAPGVPGGAIMAALAPMGSILGFSSEDQALIIALYIAMDSFGTACNVTSDGAIALIIDKLFGKFLEHKNASNDTKQPHPSSTAIP